MAGHVWFSDLAILAEKSGADGVRGAAMKSPGEGDDALAACRHARHAHRVFVGFSSGVAEERLSKIAGCNGDELLRGARAHTRVNEVCIEEQFAGLLAKRI